LAVWDCAVNANGFAKAAVGLFRKANLLLREEDQQKRCKGANEDPDDVAECNKLCKLDSLLLL